VDEVNAGHVGGSTPGHVSTSSPVRAA
jgi:hypothetical protein